MSNYTCEIVARHNVTSVARMTKIGWIRMCKTYFKNESGRARGGQKWNRIGHKGKSTHTCDECKLGIARWENDKKSYLNR